MHLSRNAMTKCVTTTVFIIGIISFALVPTLAQSNGAPLAYASAVTTTAGIAVDGVLHASDADSPTLTYALETAPVYGTVVLTDATTGAFTYTPAAGFAGYDPFTFSVSDGASTATATQMMFVVAVDAGMTSTVERVSVSNTGDQANQQSWGPGISADGRIVVFLSNASNLVASDTNGMTDVFVRDRELQTTTRINVAADGSEAAAHSLAVAVSADGRFIAFQSYAPNLVGGDTNGVDDVFVHDRQTGELTRLAVAGGGGEANAAVQLRGISGDGRDVLVLSTASNLVADDGNGAEDLFVHDRQTGITTRINPDDVRPFEARMTPDGRYITFVPGSRTTTYLHDRRTGQTMTEGSFAATNQSADGRYLVLSSSQPLTGDTNNLSDVFVRDRQTGEITQASVNSFGASGNRMSSAAILSADGRFVWFLSEANNLDNAADWDTVLNNYRRDWRFADTKFVSVRDGGTAEGTTAGSRPAATITGVTADARTLVAYTGAANLVADDTNGHWDIFVITTAPYPAADAWDSDDRQREDVGSRAYLQSTHPRRLPVTYSLLSQPAVGTMTLVNASTGEYVYIPPADFDGTVSWTFKATTADGIDSDVGRMSLSMTPVNDGPRITSYAATSTSPMVGTEVEVTIQWYDVDDGGPYTAYVNWADGTPEEAITVVSPAQTFVHRYTRVGTYQAGFRIADPTTTSITQFIPMTVGLLPGPGAYLRFNAAEADRVTVSNSGNVAAGPITVAAWLRTSASNLDMVALSKGPSAAEQWKLWRGRTGNEIFFTIGGTTAQVSARSIPLQGTDGGWHHYAGVWDGTTVRLYIDGYETMTAPGTQTQAMRSTADPICIGSSSSRGKCGSVPWSGDMGTAGVWNRALTAAEIVALSRREPFPGMALQQAAFWQVNEGAGQKLEDAGLANRDGLLGATTKVEAFDPAWRTGN
jgi:hypothetical protein